MLVSLSPETIERVLEAIPGKDFASAREALQRAVEPWVVVVVDEDHTMPSVYTNLPVRAHTIYASADDEDDVAYWRDIVLDAPDFPEKDELVARYNADLDWFAEHTPE